MTPSSAATCRSLQVSPCEAQGLLCHPVREGTIAASERQGGNMQHKNLSHPLLPSATPLPLSPPHPTQPSPPAAAPPPLQNAEHCNAFTQRKCLQTRASASDAKGKKSTQPSDKPPAPGEGRERGLLWQIAACHPMQNKPHRMLPIIPRINSWESNLGCRFPPLLAMTSFRCPCVFLQQRFLRNVLPLKRDRGSSLSLARSLSPLCLSLARSLSLLAATRARNTTTTQPPPTPFPKHIHTEETQPGEPDEPGRGWRESPASGLIAPVTFPKPLRERGKKEDEYRENTLSPLLLLRGAPLLTPKY